MNIINNIFRTKMNCTCVLSYIKYTQKMSRKEFYNYYVKAFTQHTQMGRSYLQVVMLS